MIRREKMKGSAMALQLTSAPHDHSGNAAGVDPSSFSLRLIALALTPAQDYQSQ
jgi:hypothetical protein